MPDLPGRHREDRGLAGAHFFASRDAAAPWLAEHPEAVVVGVQEGYRLAQPLVQVLLESDGPASCC